MMFVYVSTYVIFNCPEKLLGKKFKISVTFLY